MNNRGEGLVSKKLFELGEKKEVRGNKPLNLNMENRCWIVTNGKVDIFLVERKENGTSGSKTHVARIETGECFFGLATEEINLQAIGTPETECVELTMSIFRNNLEK